MCALFRSFKNIVLEIAIAIDQESAGREKWDAVKAKWKFPVSKLQTHVWCEIQ